MYLTYVSISRNKLRLSYTLFSFKFDFDLNCKYFVLQTLFIKVLLKLYAKFQLSTISVSGQKVCGGWWLWVVGGGGVETNYSVQL